MKLGADNSSSASLPFALRERWIVTVEGERQLVNVRHRTRWYAVARRIGHEDRKYRCASRSDAVTIAGWLREGFARQAAMARDPAFQQLSAWFKQQSPERQAQLRNESTVPISG